MNCKKCLLIILLGAAVAGFAFLGAAHAQEREAPFPQYGTGPVQVFIYTDYFCPPCRAMEPLAEPVLQDLLKRNRITLTFIDVPFHRLTPLYAKYFLYALNARNDPDHAFHVRNVLIAATADRQMTTEERVGKLLKSRGIPYAVFEARPVFNRYNDLIRENKVEATPTCIIVKNGKKESFVGGPNIVAALKRLS